MDELKRDRSEALAVRCRNCGHVFQLPEFHRAILLTCPECEWQEVIPAHRRLARELDQSAGAAFQNLQAKRASALKAMDRLYEMTQRDFEGFCAALFAGLGLAITEPPAGPDAGRDLDVALGDQTAYVRCLHARRGHKVDLEEVQNLAGAMRHGEVQRGIFVTTGSFNERCVELAKTVEIALIDDAQLREKIAEANVDALLPWLGAEPDEPDALELEEE